MSTQTEHYQLSLREGTDIFNPLSTNDNFTKIDELLFQGASGGLITGTPVVSGSLLSFQGLTLAAADTVVKFKLEDGQSVSSVTFGGSTIPIVDLSGAGKTLTGGFWIGYVDTNSKFRVIAYPDVVNAQTFNGEAASYYATKAGLDAVNETAGNAVSTATAAATVANQALDTANLALSGGGVKIATGSYTGDGDSGASNPVKLDFDFEPLIVILNTQTTNTFNSGPVQYMLTRPSTILGFNSVRPGTVVWSSTSVSFYNTGAEYMFNTYGEQYSYIAIGITNN